MVVGAASSVRATFVEPAKRQRAARTNRPLAHLDMTTARGRRIADLARALSKALAEPTEVERQAAIVTAAELTVLAEQARADALNGAGDLEMVVRLQGAADRALRRLGLKATGAPRGQTLADYLAERAAEGSRAKNARSAG